MAGGGRYDDLVRRFTGQEVPATGISIGVDRLLAALQTRGSVSDASAGPVLVTVMDRDRLAEYQAMAAELRGAGIRAEMYLGNPRNFGSQLRYADRRDCPLALIQGSEERARNVVIVKNLALGMRLAAEISSNEEWKNQPAQREVARSDLVQEVLNSIAMRSGYCGPNHEREVARSGTGTHHRGLCRGGRGDGGTACSAPPPRRFWIFTAKTSVVAPIPPATPLAGELMLRPDFTVPIAQMHLDMGREASRYAYAGKVFRTQETGSNRASEYVQVGLEVFGGDAPQLVDAEVFALFSRILKPLRLRAATGDMGVLLAAVRGLSTTETRKAALMRHVWRPRRFRALLDRFGGRIPASPARAELVERARSSEAALETGPVIGLRSAGEIETRIQALVEDADAPPVPLDEVSLIDEIVGLRDRAPLALERLRRIAGRLPSTAPAVERVAARLEALDALGIDISALAFEGSYGRTTMEYYDGFVFGFYSESRPDLPPVATGGRYDALTRALGGNGAAPAIGGVIRPALLLELS